MSWKLPGILKTHFFSFDLFFLFASKLPNIPYTYTIFFLYRNLYRIYLIFFLNYCFKKSNFYTFALTYFIYLPWVQGKIPSSLWSFIWIDLFSIHQGINRNTSVWFSKYITMIFFIKYTTCITWAEQFTIAQNLPIFWNL